MIRHAKPDDAAAICAIYNFYVLESTITFEESAVTIDEMAERIRDVSVKWTWYVFELNGAIVGYAYATPWRTRCAYRLSVETTVYVSNQHPRDGIGINLYRALLDDLRAKGVHAVIAGIAQPNIASIGLHEKCGFEKVAHFKEVGRKFERWIDVGYWQILLTQ